MSRIGRKRQRLDPVFPPPDVGAMIQVSGIALVALVACTFDALRLARALPGAALAAGVEYVAGLIVVGRRATRGVRKLSEADSCAVCPFSDEFGILALPDLSRTVVSRQRTKRSDGEMCKRRLCRHLGAVRSA